MKEVWNPKSGQRGFRRRSHLPHPKMERGLVPSFRSFGAVHTKQEARCGENQGTVSPQIHPAATPNPAFAHTRIHRKRPRCLPTHSQLLPTKSGGYSRVRCLSHTVTIKTATHVKYGHTYEGIGTRRICGHSGRGERPKHRG